MRAVPVLLLALPLAAQVLPQQRIHRGLTNLFNGTWTAALNEWNTQGTLTPQALETARVQLEALASTPRGLEALHTPHPPLRTSRWERHWVMATHDAGPLFLTFDFMLHRDEWRLFRLQVTDDPKVFLPDLERLTREVPRK